MGLTSLSLLSLGSLLVFLLFPQSKAKIVIDPIDPVNRSGNHVILRCGDGDIDVLLAHFRPQSLSVQTGMNIQVGDRLAEVGNSGASDEPHLYQNTKKRQQMI